MQMQDDKIKISVIIVNYNVKSFLEQALLSLRRALKNIPAEIFVVDNASIDGSAAMIRQRFKEVQLIENDKNLGFSAANNQAIQKAGGDFIALLNPDTVVQEDTFVKLLQFFDENEQASMATCKILNPDGSFSVDCRHSVPTPLTAFWKLIGFSSLFPKNKIFGKYNLTYLDENETYQVEAISGSFMMMRKEVVDQIGLLDETFFMYCEDIDYCHRINQSGGQIYYVPDSQIIHYKGESTKKNNLDYVITFNRSLYQFYKKHYQQKYVFPFKLLIILGIIFRGLFIFLKNNLALYYPILVDFIILNSVMFLSFLVRYEMKSAFTLDDFFGKYIFINLITSAAYYVSSLFFDSLNKDRYSITKIIKANFSTFIFVAALTFFIKQFAFSRLVVLASALITPVLMVLWRIILRASGKRSSSALGRNYFLKRTLIVGFDNETRRLLDKLRNWVGSGIEVVGLAGLDEKQIGDTMAGIPVVTSLAGLPDYLALNRINMVIFTTHQVPYEAVLSTMSRVQNPRVEFKMVPDHLEFMIGKSSIERLDAVPLVDIEYAYKKPFNRFVKRSFDLGIALLLIILFAPVGLLSVIVQRKKITKKEIFVNKKSAGKILWTGRKGLLCFYLHLWNIIKGNLSFVGAPLSFEAGDASRFDYKPGLTGLVQINPEHTADKESRENYELHYLKNQGLLVDLEIILRTVF